MDSNGFLRPTPGTTPTDLLMASMAVLCEDFELPINDISNIE